MVNRPQLNDLHVPRWTLLGYLNGITVATLLSEQERPIPKSTQRANSSASREWGQESQAGQRVPLLSEQVRQGYSPTPERLFARCITASQQLPGQSPPSGTVFLF